MNTTKLVVSIALLGLVLAFSSIYVSAHGLDLLLPWFRQAPKAAWAVVGILSASIILLPAGFFLFTRNAFAFGLIIGVVAIGILGLYSIVADAPVGYLFYIEYIAMTVAAGVASWIGHWIRRRRSAAD